MPPPPAAKTVVDGRCTEESADLEAQFREREARLRREETALAEREDRLSRREAAMRDTSRKAPRQPWYREPAGSSLLGD